MYQRMSAAAADACRLLPPSAMAMVMRVMRYLTTLETWSKDV